MDPAGWLKACGIGLTGGIGTGKSTVAKLLRQRGFEVIDADLLARAVTAPSTAGLRQIAQRFGADAIGPDGALNRKYLSMRVFRAPEERKALEEITHPLIRAALLQQVKGLGLEIRPRWFFYEAALIFEINSAAAYRCVWSTLCPPALQTSRLMRRDSIDAGRAAMLIANQMDAGAKAERADAVIDTSGDLADVERQLDGLLAALGPLA